MSYIPYKNYSPSKTYLLDEIPSNWEIIPMNQFVELVTDYVSNGSFASLRTNVEYKNEEDFAILVRLADNSNNFAGPFVYINEDAYNFLSKSKLFEGDIVLSNTGSIGSIFKVPNLGKPMSLAPNSLLIRFRNQTLADYFFYLFSCDIGRKFLESITTVTTQPKFNKTDFRKLPMLMPPLKEQKQIANYLDKKTAKIDENISKNKKLIELLEEKRTALINEVVTKGLNPDVPMKDSGVEWIGEIPEHWEIIKVKNCSTLINDKKDFADENDKYIGLEHIESETGKLLNYSKEGADGTVNKFKKDMVLFGKLRPYLAKVIKTSFDGVCSTELLIFKTNESLIPKYLFYFMLSNRFIEQVNSSTYGVKMPRASPDFINSLPIALPNTNEQQGIVDYLDTKTTKINNTLSKIKENIVLLEEYKTSLIHHVVTGKIDVRGEEI